MLLTSLAHKQKQQINCFYPTEAKSKHTVHLGEYEVPVSYAGQLHFACSLLYIPCMDKTRATLHGTEPYAFQYIGDKG